MNVQTEIKNKFSIKDLENLSGIKAHTIRIWEKRYNLFSPDRTETNIRFYSLESLQKLLNVTLLNNNGYKISKIAALQPEEIKRNCNDLISKEATHNNAINNFKISMLNFDVALFNKTYTDLCEKESFKEVFLNYFGPFLNEIGLLWQTDSILPAHEHFISCLIRQKLLLQIESLHKTPTNDDAYVLFLPEKEIHDLGLLFVAYELMNKGKHVIYLGQSLPLSSLRIFENTRGKKTFIAYSIVAPEHDEIQKYVNDFCTEILGKSNDTFWLIGKKTETLSLPKNEIRVQKFKGLQSVIEKIQTLA